MSKISILGLNILLLLMVFSGCSEGNFSGDVGRGLDSQRQPPQPPPQSGTPTSEVPSGDSVKTDGGTVIQHRACTQPLVVPGRANLYFAGSSPTSEIEYFVRYKRTDRAGTESPIQLVPDRADCLLPGSKILFNVAGSISHDLGRSATDADGKLGDIQPHRLGAKNGKSNVTAPLNAMMGVFLGPDEPVVAPAELNFSTEASRNYETLSPLVGQIFYVGDGKTSAGKAQLITVPQGATRLYLGIMDAFEWNNNEGQLSGGFSVVIK